MKSVLSARCFTNIFRPFQMYLQQSTGGVNMQLPQVSGASCSQAEVRVQSVTCTAHSTTHHGLQQQQAPPSQQQNSQGSILTQVSVIHSYSDSKRLICDYFINHCSLSRFMTQQTEKSAVPNNINKRPNGSEAFELISCFFFFFFRFTSDPSIKDDIITFV